MVIPDELRKCVVFIGAKTTYDDYHLFGTAFWVGDPETQRSFLVTAGHVLDEVHNRLADTVYLRVNINGEDEAHWH